MDRATTWSNAAVLELLRAEHAVDVGTADWIGSGHWSDCFAFSHHGAEHVVRLGRHVEDFRKDLVAVGYRQPALPIPAVSKIGRARDDWFAISERVRGEPLEQADCWDELVEPVVDLLEALREADIDHTSGWGRWTGEGRAPSSSWRDFLLDVDQDPPGGRTEGWKQRLASSPTAARAFAEGYAELDDIASNDVPRSLVHNDLINRNTLAQTGSIAGVFDWGNSMYGDHLYDVALFCFWQPWLPKVQDRAVLAGLRERWSTDVSDLAPRFRACVLHIGLEHIAYHTFRQTWSEVGAVCERMEAIAERGVSDW